MKTYDLALIWEWPYDKPFNRLVQDGFAKLDLSVLFINVDNLLFVENKISKGEIQFNWYLDRASESDPRFLSLIQMCQILRFKAVNPPRKVQKSINKVYLHRLLINHNLTVPQTVILPPYNKKAELPFFTFTEIGIPFVMKPARGGGGEGVHANLTELDQVQYHRKEFPNDEYLVQETIVPKSTPFHPLWFRSYFVFGQIYICFWNPQTRIYTPFSEGTMDANFVNKIKSITMVIARLAKLNFFSSEIVIQSDDKFVVVDTINDPIDFRPKSIHLDGIPDCLLDTIVQELARFINLSHSKMLVAV
jgi:hypothetical protein